VALKRIRQSLSYATCALLGVSNNVSNAAEPWDIDIGVLNYIEQDRNTGIEFLLDAKKTYSDSDEFILGLELDTVTGATPNGATASNVAQTFTQSSGSGSYTTQAGDLPVDDTHMDTRLAVVAGYRDQHSSDLIIGYDGRISMEFDYLSIGFGNHYQLDFNQHNTSWSFGFNSEYNRVHPVGNIPDPLALMTPEDTPQNRGVAAKTRLTNEVGTGITQVIDRRSLFQVRYSKSYFAGYLTDPYKIVSIIDDQDQSNLGATLDYRFENRPDSREMDTLYLAYKRDIGGAVLDLSIRRSEDDWDISATTYEARYRHRLAGGAYVQPHIRFYRQSEAEFFRHSLVVSEPLPEDVSADTRLGAFDAITIGLRYGSKIVDHTQHSFVAEFYTQDGESNPDDAVGLQTEQDLFPSLKTLIFKYFYSTRW